MDNENGTDDNMSTNRDITLRKAKRQKASFNSTNLSNSLNECTEGINGLNKEAQNNLVPVRLWIRGHYTKLTRNNKARCIHCNREFIICMNKLADLHKHLVETHPDKLIEEEKKEMKFHWTWDYYIVKSNTQARCKLCKVYMTRSRLKRHLSTRHEISGPTSDHVIDNENSSDNLMDANQDITIRKPKGLEASSNSTNLSNSLNECTEGINGLNEEAQNDLVPVRLWIRGHYTNLIRNNKTRCIHCNNTSFCINIRYLGILHKHLVDAHADKLTEQEKKEVKFHWVWDYYILKSNTEARCKLCKVTVRYMTTTHLKRHLSTRHKISGPTSDNVIDNESSSDNDMDANEDVTIRKAKLQEASSNSTNLSDSLYECAEGTEAINEGTSYNLIPIRRWIREHYTKLTRNRARCNHCNEKCSIYIKHLNSLHKHLVEAHPDKLTEVEKNEVKFHWTWDYYIVKSNTEARCKLCKGIVRYSSTSDVRIHLSTHHKISGPTSDNVIDNESSSDNDMDANEDVTIRKAKRQEASFNSTNLSDSLHECAEGTEAINEGTSYNLIPIRRWIREHYAKVTRNRARCNHCNEKYSIHKKHLNSLHKHLVEAHPDKLAEVEKNEVKFHWTWDYYIVKSNTEARCKLCKGTVRYRDTSDVRIHLSTHHKISGPTSDNVIDNESSSDNDMDANEDVTIRKAKRQEASFNSTNLSDSLHECAEGTEAINEGTSYNLIPIRRWIREHYTKLTRNRARCNHCNEKCSIYIKHLNILHKHLVEAHPDKLTEVEKNEVKFHWTWDYYIVKSNTEARCKLCKGIVRYSSTSDVRIHLSTHHKITGPTSDNVIDNESSSDNDMDANEDIIIRAAKYQKASCNTTNLSNNLNECTEGTKGFKEEAQNNLALHECRISGTTSVHVIDNENSSDNFMDANQDITIRKPKGQEALFNSTNLSNSLNDCTEGINGLNEEAQNNLVPVLLWIRGHYTKLTRNNKARCIHCNRKFIIYMNKLAALHKHLVETHPDKLTEDEKKEVKFYDLDLGLFYSWTWDYFTIKDCTMAICKICKATSMIKNVANFKGHLESIHKISGPTSDHVMDNENGTDDNMSTNRDITLRKAKRQKASFNSTNLSDSLNECTEGINGLNEEAQNNLVPVRLWIRGHYTKLTRNNKARCIHCNREFIIYMNKLADLHKHLVETHPDKLIEEEKKEMKFHWAWDYYIVKSNTQARCKLCKVTVRYMTRSHLKRHLSTRHEISGPTSDNVIDNESSSDNDMDANEDVTIRKAKRQEASFNSTNLSDSLHECAEGTEAINEGTSYNLIPIRRWIREHYAKVTRNRARCNHCNEKYSIHMNHLNSLHKHLVEAHPDKLAEVEKNEVKFHWTWDYYIVKSNTEARCKLCKVTVRYRDTSDVRIHLSTHHKITGPTSDNVIDNESSSDNDMDANEDIIIRAAKYQKASCNTTNLSNNLNECTEGTKGFKEEAQNNLALHECRISGTTSVHVIDNENSSDNFMDANQDITIRKPKGQEALFNSTNLSNSLNDCTEGINGLNEEAQNSLVPVLLWIRGHYTKLTRNNKARCIHCNRKFIIYMNKLAALHKHLVETHPDKLTEDEKKEVKFYDLDLGLFYSWTWDYFTIKDCTMAICKICKATSMIKNVANFKGHLESIHKISGPTSDHVMDNENGTDDNMSTNRDITLRKAKRQKASFNSTNLSDSLNECTEGINGLNEVAQNNLVPVLLWIRGHYTKLTRNNKARCIHCNRKFIIYMNKLAALHKHLVETHPDKLTEVEKKEVKFYDLDLGLFYSWTWDYFTIKDCTTTICKICKATLMIKNVANFKGHLGSIHKISGPTSDHVMDNENSTDDDMGTNRDITLRKAKRQKASSDSTNLSDNLYECAERTEAINE